MHRKREREDLVKLVKEISPTVKFFSSPIKKWYKKRKESAKTVVLLKKNKKNKKKENERRSPPLLYAYQSALARLSPERDRWDFHRRNRHVHHFFFFFCGKTIFGGNFFVQSLFRVSSAPQKIFLFPCDSSRRFSSIVVVVVPLSRGLSVR